MNRVSSFLISSFVLSLSLLAQGPSAPLSQAVPPQSAGGDLRILPMRVVLEGRERASEVMLQNEGKTKATYRIFFKEMEMTPSGKLVDRRKGDKETTAVDIIRYSPRQVELAPGEAQNVRIQLRKPEDLPDGEYRSHLVFQAVPPAEAPAAPDADSDAQQLNFQIRPIYGISIPVIVRHGQCQGDVSLSGLQFGQTHTEDGLPLLRVLLERKGNRSILGDLSVKVEGGGNLKKGTVLYDYKGVAVYPETPSREVRLPIPEGKEGALNGTRLKITFTPKDIKGEAATAFIDIKPHS